MINIEINKGKNLNRQTVKNAEIINGTEKGNKLGNSI